MNTPRRQRGESLEDTHVGDLFGYTFLKPSSLTSSTFALGAGS
jgi:hypothetical protein